MLLHLLYAAENITFVVLDRKHDKYVTGERKHI